MIVLDYSLNPKELQKIKGFNLNQATDTDFSYYLFCGNIIFRIDSQNYDALWGWIPVIDFAAQLYLILSTIQDGDKKVFNFTESEAIIEFYREADYVLVKPSYVISKAKINYPELAQASKNFLKKVLNEISSIYPQLLQNTYFIETFKLLDDV